jgi:CheY-like chemotaxis protein
MSPTQAKHSWLANQPVQRKILIAIGLLLGIFLIANLFTLSTLAREQEARKWTRHTYLVLLKIDQVQRAALSHQVTARDYLMTRDPAALVTFKANERSMLDNIADLRMLTADNPLQQARIDRLQTMAQQWEREASSSIQAIGAIAAIDPVEEAVEQQRIQRNYLIGRTVRISDITALLDMMAATENELLTDRAAVLADTLDTMRAINVASALLSILVGVMVITLTFRLVTRPLRRMTGLMTRLAAHDHDIEIRGATRADEIGQIARALQVFRQMAIDTSAQNWIKTEASVISSRLQGATGHAEFAERLTGELVPLLKAGVGMFYIHNDIRHRMELIGSYGLRQGGRLIDRYAPGEGLVGQCAVERKTLFLDNVPEDYVRIHSGSGEGLPRHVVVLPVLARDELLGVLELASFDPITPLQTQLLEELLPIVALSLENLSRAIATRDLLERTQEQADELRTSEETLIEQQQELRGSNEALHAKTAELEEQSQRLVASEEELRVQAEELQTSNEELREKSATLNQQKEVLETLQLETEEKADELARASQYKSEFLANMSHELRTPLNSLLILSRSLAENESGNLDDEQVESARIINDSGSNLLRLINDILDLSKVEAGKMELVIDELPLADLARTLRRTFSHVAQEKSLAFTVEIDPDLPETIRTDGPRLEQVANNLLSNAFKFTSEGAVLVRIARPGADLAIAGVLTSENAIAISVADSGIGIPQDTLRRIFSAFEQVDASTSRQYGGTGLGLTISRRITELLGGEIVVHSQGGVGSTFTVVLPEKAPEQTGPVAAKRVTMREIALPHSPALLPDSIEDDRAAIEPGQTSILVIEDDPSFARILADMIHRKGHRVLAAADGESGLQLARQFRPTGILLDVMLPGMDGWTVLDRLKADAATRHIPVHFISAVDEASRGRELGAVGFLTKPVTREAIGEAFERLLHFAEGRARHLLIVDDDADSRAAVRTLLRNDSVTIAEAASAEDALEMTANTDFDCIVLDLGLPGMSGMDFLDRLAATSGGVPPVVVYSGRDLSREENLKLRQYTDSIVVKGARSPERLLDEVSLFLHSMKHSGKRARTAAERPEGDSELNGRKVLLVDDDMRNLFALSKVLRGKGLAVAMAQDGGKALKTLEDDDAIELVLMDIMMPGMDGYATMREIRSQPQFESLPIIALTAKAMQGDREKCLEAGANDYLSKPIDVDKLLSMLRVWLP